MCVESVRSRTYIKLSTIRRSSPVECEHLGAEEVLSVFETLRDVNHLLPRIPNHNVGAPGAAIVAGILNLEPILGHCVRAVQAIGISANPY